jgi:hypothetical protein
MKTLLAILATFALGVVVTDTAHGVVVCQKRGKSNFTLRETCKRREVQVLDLDTLIEPPESPGPDGPQGPEGSEGSGLVVRDATGALVGRVVALPDAEPGVSYLDAKVLTVVRDLDGVLVQLGIETDPGRQGFRDLPIPPAGRSYPAPLAYFENSSECFGTPLSTDPANYLEPGLAVPRARFHQSTGTVYYPTGTFANRQTKSLLRYPSGGCADVGGVTLPGDLCCEPISGPTFAGTTELTTLDASTLGLVPPFHVEIP